MQASSDQLLKLPPISRSTIIRRYEFPQHIQQMLAVKKNIKEEMSSGKPTQQTDQLMFEFIAKVNYANCIYTSTHLLPDGKHYKFFVNRYNNPILIRKTFMRRPWWKPALTDDAPDLNFAWTQLPIKALYSRIPALNSTGRARRVDPVWVSRLIMILDMSTVTFAPLRWAICTIRPSMAAAS